jgi:uncharacterized membrane protein
MRIPNPTKLTNKQLLVTTVSIFCIGQVTNHTPLREPVQWLFVILLITWVIKFSQTNAGKKVGDALLFVGALPPFW